jgi:hypothetical protein
MKKVLMVFVGMLMVFGMVGPASATSTTFNFSLGGLTLDQYMDTTFGSNVDISNLGPYTSSQIFGGSAAIRTTSSSGSLDFDPSGSGLPSTFKILSVSFTWGVYDSTSGYDFVLDVYNDANSSWVHDYFTKSGVSDNAYGPSGLLVFDSSMEVTRLQIHDSSSHDVGIDDLVINDNRTVDPPGAAPEPATMLLLGSGLVGLAGFARRRFKK